MALPITVGTANFTAPCGGPFKSGSSFYIVHRSNSATSDLIRVSKADSDDPSSGWTVQDSANEPLEADLNGGPYHSVLVGTTIHIVSQNVVDGDIQYHTFDCSTNTWSITNESVTTAPVNLGAEFCSIDVRSDGDVIVAYQGAPEANMGSDYDRVDLARREGGTWTADISIDNLGKTTTHMRYPFVKIADQTNDRAHIFYNDVANSDLFYSTYLSGNTWGHQHTTADSTSTVIANGASGKKVISYNNGTNTKVRCVYGDASSTNVSTVGFNDADSPGSSIAISTDITSTETANHSVGFAYAVDDSNDTQYLLTADGTTTSSNINEHETGSDDDTWSANLDELTSVNLSFNPNLFSANIYDNSGTVLAYLYRDGSNYRYNERTLAAGGSVGAATGTGTATGFSGSAGAASAAAAATGFAGSTGAAAGVGTAAGVAIVLPEWDQDSYRFRNDDGGAVVEDATWMAAANTQPPDIATESNFRLRFLIQETAGVTAAPPGAQPKFDIQFRQNGGAWTDPDALGGTTQPVRLFNGPVTHAASLSQQLGSGTFRDGSYQEVDITGDKADYQALDEYEFEWNLEFNSTATTPANAGDTFEFRTRVNDGYPDSRQPYETYTNTPSVVVGAKGASAGVGTATGFSGSTGTSAGVGTAEGIAATPASVGASAGLSTATAFSGSQAVSNGIATVTGFAGSTGAAAGVATANAITEYIGASAGVGTAAGFAGSRGDAAGVATAVGITEYVGASAGVGAATGFSGSAGAAAGVGVASGFAGATGNAAGVGTANGFRGSTGSAAGIGTATGIRQSEVSEGAAAGAATVTGFSGSTGAAAGVGTAAGITEYIGAATGLSTAAGFAGSRGDTAGTSTAIGITEYVGASAGLSTATAFSGSIGQSAGIAIVTGITEYVGQSAGASTAAAFAGSRGDSTGIAATEAFAGSQGSSTATSTATAFSGATGNAAGISVVAGFAGSIGSAAGAAAVTGFSEAGLAEGASAGASVATGFAGSIGSAAGTSTATGIADTGIDIGALVARKSVVHLKTPARASLR